MVTIKFEGGKQLAAALADLSSRMSKRLLTEALTEAAEPIRKAAAAAAPRRAPAPDIAANIVVSRAKTEDQAAVKVGPAKGFAYGLPLELGTVKMSARPFLRPAFDANATKAIGIVGEVLWRELAAKGISRSLTVDTDVEGEER